MSETDSTDTHVAGERGATAANRERSVQSRVSSLLAFGLMSALGLGMLTWYYAHAMGRQGAARQSAQAAATRRAEGDLPLPSLGRIDAPRLATPEAVPSAASLAAAQPVTLQEVAPLPLAEAPQSGSLQRSHYSGTSTYGAAANAPPAKSPAELALERELSGQAYAAQTNGPGAATPPSSDAPEGTDPRGTDPRGPTPMESPTTESHTLAAWLRPTVTTAVRAQVLPTMRLLLPKGAFIDCTLETAIDSTLPGMTTCVTATDTFGADGQVVLLERGTKLVGELRGQVQQGAARVFVLWTEARTPTGVVIPLDSPGADELGRAGLSGTVERHFWERFGAALLVSVLDGAVQAAVQSTSRGNGTVIYNPSAGEGVMTEVLKGTVNIAPTIVKPQGDRIQVLVARDLDFRSVYELRSDDTAR
jgi:type IV secretion system protein VirB10